MFWSMHQTFKNNLVHPVSHYFFFDTFAVKFKVIGCVNIISLLQFPNNT